MKSALRLLYLFAAITCMTAYNLLAASPFGAAPLYLGFAATQGIDTPEHPGVVVPLKMAAATKIFAGTIVAVNAAGYAVAGADTAGLVGYGRAEETVDNTDGDAGDLSINVRRGVFLWANSSANPLTQAALGTIAYVEDDVTVAVSTNNAVKAGTVVRIDSEGYWIDTRYHVPTVAAPADGSVTAAKLANAVADAIPATTVAVANTGTPDGVAHITGQVKDVQGNNLAGRFLVRVFIDDAAYTAVEDLGTLTAAAGTLLLKETTDDAYADVVTAADGSWGLDLDTAADGTIHAHAAVAGVFATANAAITGN
jgi:hypothetical protein